MMLRDAGSAALASLRKAKALGERATGPCGNGATRSAADPASSDPPFSIGPRGTSPGGLFGTRMHFTAIPHGMAGFGPPWTTPEGQQASIMSTRGTRNRPCSARGGFAKF